MTCAYAFDAGPFIVIKYESVVIGLGTRVEVVGEEQKASLFVCAVTDDDMSTPSCFGTLELG